MHPKRSGHEGSQKQAVPDSRCRGSEVVIASNLAIDPAIIPAMSITPEEVDRVARLARLYLSDSERAQLTEQLGRIVDFVEQLNELDTATVEPMAHAADITNAFADDIPVESLDREAALGNAPNRDDDCFRVPAVLGN